MLEAERTLVYAGAAAAAFLIVPRDRADELVLGVLAGAGVATLGGLVEHVLGSGTPERPARAARRLRERGGHPRDDDAAPRARARLRRAWWRGGLGAGISPPATAALYLSLSRGSLLVAALGLVVLRRDRALDRPPGTAWRSSPSRRP